MNLSSQPAASAFQIVRTLVENGYTAYFAGGCVRDDLMGKPPSDFDIATNATPDIVEKIFPKTVPVGRQFGVILVLLNEHPFEIATFRREGAYADGRHPSYVEFTAPEEDAHRRDFTVNGLFYDPIRKKVLDFVGGQNDIRSKIIRAIGNPLERFGEDKLRILRAIRFAANLDYAIEAKTWDAVRKMAADIHQVSPERIRDEIVKMLQRPNAARGFRLLSESGLLKEIFPEIEAMKGVQQPPAFHPEGDVFEHTLALLERLNRPSKVLALSALFHDIGKPATQNIRPDKITFYEHAPVGAALAKEVMRRLRFSNQEIEDIAACIANHMTFADVKKMRIGKLKRLLARPTFPDELKLHKIDCEASHGMIDNYDFLVRTMGELEKENLKPKPFINGHDLLAAGMKAGPAMKPLLEEIYDLQLEGTLQDRDDALLFLKKKLSK